jgi:BMFP domain-containing protein YqiC
MSNQPKFFEELARMAGGAMNMFAGLREEMEAMARQQIETMLSRMDVVKREEFEAVMAVAAKARSEQEKLEARVSLLEEQLKAKKTTKAAPKVKAAPKRTVTSRPAPPRSK